MVTFTRARRLILPALLVAFLLLSLGVQVASAAPVDTGATVVAVADNDAPTLPNVTPIATADVYCPCWVCKAENAFGWHTQDNGWPAWGPYIKVTCGWQ
jgi:hypothetical protein